MSIFRFIKCIAEGTPITVNGDGQQTRDFTYVDDIARGTILAGRPFDRRMKPETGRSREAEMASQSDGPSGRQSRVPLGAGGGANLKPEGSESNSGLKSQVSDLSGGQQPAFDVINLGGGNRPITLNAVIRLIEKELNEQSATEVSAFRSQVSAFKAVINRQPASAVDMRDTQADISKAARLLGWKPEISPEEGIKRTVAWYLGNRSWLKDVRV